MTVNPIGWVRRMWVADDPQQIARLCTELDWVRRLLVQADGRNADLQRALDGALADLAPPAPARPRSD
jgi:hypothetical protein